MLMSIIRDVVNMRTDPGPTATNEFHVRIAAFQRIAFIVGHRMAPEESAAWTRQKINEFVWSIPNQDAEAISLLPTEDVQWYVEECLEDLEHVASVIDSLDH